MEIRVEDWWPITSSKDEQQIHWKPTGEVRAKTVRDCNWKKSEKRVPAKYAYYVGLGLIRGDMQ